MTYPNPKSTPPSTLALFQRSALDRLVPGLTPMSDPDIFEAASDLSAAIDGTEGLHGMLSSGSLASEIHDLSRALNETDEVLAAYPEEAERSTAIRDGILSFISVTLKAKKAALEVDKTEIKIGK